MRALVFAPFLLLVIFIITSFLAWLQHVITCIVNETWVLLVVGALAFPIGVIHGWMLWLGIV